MTSQSRTIPDPDALEELVQEVSLPEWHIDAIFSARFQEPSLSDAINLAKRDIKRVFADATK